MGSSNVQSEPIIARLAAFAALLRDTSDQCTICRAIEHVTSDCIGHDLFTMMAFDADIMEVQRIYSSMPDAYPTAGRKRKRDTAWGEQVLLEGKPFIGRTETDIHEHFDDSDTIIGLGMVTVLNLPVYQHGKIVGTFNLLRKSMPYTRTEADIGIVVAGLLGAQGAFFSITCDGG